MKNEIIASCVDNPHSNFGEKLDEASIPVLWNLIFEKSQNSNIKELLITAEHDV